MSIAEKDRKQLKGQGFLSNKDGVHFAARVITENGVLSAAQLKNVCEAAEKFGNGDIAFTSRMTLEVQGIPYENVKDFQEYIAQENLVTGGTGAKVRPVVACKGTVCGFGLIDTQKLATEIHKRYYVDYGTLALPHKFKIAVGGCPNNCVKPDLNDFGIVGQRKPIFQEELCKGCKKCSVETACPMGAAKVKDGLLQIDKSVCNNCGRCIGNCNFNAITDGVQGYKIYLGGRWGKEIRIGSPLAGMFTKEEAISMIEKALLLYKDQGYAGERFGVMIDRIGLPAVEAALTNDEILSRKGEIVQAEIKKRPQTVNA